MFRYLLDVYLYTHVSCSDTGALQQEGKQGEVSFLCESKESCSVTTLQWHCAYGDICISKGGKQ